MELLGYVLGGGGLLILVCTIVYVYADAIACTYDPDYYA